MRQVLFAVGAVVMNAPEVMVSQAEEKFDSQGVLIDERTAGQLKKFWQGFLSWINKCRS